MKQSILLALLAALSGASGCAVSPDIHQAQANELKALGDYHKAEKELIKARQAESAAAALLASSAAAREKAQKEMEQAKAALSEALNK